MKKNLAASLLTARSNMLIPNSRLVFTALLMTGLPSLGGCAAAGVAAAINAISNSSSDNNKTASTYVSISNQLESLVQPSTGSPGLFNVFGSTPVSGFGYTKLANTGYVESGSAFATTADISATYSSSGILTSIAIADFGISFTGADITQNAGAVSAFSRTPFAFAGQQGVNASLSHYSASYIGFGAWERYDIEYISSSSWYVRNRKTGVYSFGENTPSQSVPSSGTANFNGGAVGYIISQSAEFIGDVSASINFGTKSGFISLSNVRDAIPSRTWGTPPNFASLGFSVPILVGGASFNKDSSVPASGAMAGGGALDGSFFGPQANEIAGKFKIGTATAVGSFGASR